MPSIYGSAGPPVVLDGFHARRTAFTAPHERKLTDKKRCGGPHQRGVLYAVQVSGKGRLGWIGARAEYFFYQRRRRHIGMRLPVSSPGQSRVPNCIVHFSPKTDERKSSGAEAGVPALHSARNVDGRIRCRSVSYRRSLPALRRYTVLRLGYLVCTLAHRAELSCKVGKELPKPGAAGVMCTATCGVSVRYCTATRGSSMIDLCVVISSVTPLRWLDVG